MTAVLKSAGFAAWSVFGGSVVGDCDAHKRGYMSNGTANRSYAFAVAVSLLGFTGSQLTLRDCSRFSSTKLSLLLGGLSMAHLVSAPIPLGRMEKNGSNSKAVVFGVSRAVLLPFMAGMALHMTWRWSQRVDLRNFMSLPRHDLSAGTLAGLRLLAFPIATFVIQMRADS